MVSPVSFVGRKSGALSRFVDAEVRHLALVRGDRSQAVSEEVWQQFMRARPRAQLNAAIAAMLLERPRADIDRLLSSVLESDWFAGLDWVVPALLLAGGRPEKLMRGTDSIASQFKKRRGEGPSFLAGSSGSDAAALLAFALLSPQQRIEFPGWREAIQGVRSGDRQIDRRLRSLRPISTRGTSARKPSRSPVPADDVEESVDDAVNDNVRSVTALIAQVVVDTQVPDVDDEIGDVLAGSLPVLDPLALSTLLVVINEEARAGSFANDRDLLDRFGRRQQGWPQGAKGAGLDDAYGTYLRVAWRRWSQTGGPPEA